MDLRPQTPGPWSVDNYGAEPAVRTDGGMAIVPRVFGTLADARLIASAPDLLAACEAMLRAGKSPGDIDAAYSLMRSAVAEAKGETP